MPTWVSTVLGDIHSSLGDRLVGSAFGHQGQYGPLTFAEGGRGLSSGLVTSRATTSGRSLTHPGDPPDGVGELGDVGDPVLQHVAQPAGVVREQLDDVLGLDVVRQHQDGGARPRWRISRAASRPSVVWVGGIRMSATTTSGRSWSTSASSWCGSAAVPTTSRPGFAQEPLQAFAQQHGVLGDDDPQGR